MPRRKALKLKCELIPRPCWGRSLANLLPSAQWARIREAVREEAEHRCEICGAKGTLHCHEVWHYDEKRSVQQLQSVQAICEKCHAVKHMGRTRLVGGNAAAAKAVVHFMKVNGVGKSAFADHYKQAMTDWTRRSHRAWTTHFGPYNHLLSPISPDVVTIESLGWNRTVYRGEVQYHANYGEWALRVFKREKQWLWVMDGPNPGEQDNTIIGLEDNSRDAMAAAMRQCEAFGTEF